MKIITRGGNDWTERDGAIQVSQEIEADGATLLAAACEHGLEGGSQFH
ncbi:hypothetical protein [Neorhizobium tomejilense]